MDSELCRSMDHQDHCMQTADGGHPSDEIHSEIISIGNDSGVHDSIGQSSFCGQEEGGDCGDGAEILDPRVQIELEKLNSSSEVINKLELDFRDLLDDSKCHLDRLQKKIGNSVKKARPY